MTEYNPFQQEIADAVCADFYDKFKDDDLWEETAIEIVKKQITAHHCARREIPLFWESRSYCKLLEAQT